MYTYNADMRKHTVGWLKFRFPKVANGKKGYTKK
jgi:hypothetical protein